MYRLSLNNYQRPDVTITDAVQNKKDIEEQLINYEEVEKDNIDFIKKNTNLKYVSFNKLKKKEIFRFGGFLLKIHKDYVVLKGKNNLSFSVQRYTKNDQGKILHVTRFFKIIDDNDIITETIKKELLDKTTLVEEQTTLIEQQLTVIEKQKEELATLKKKLSKLQKKGI